MRKRRLFHALCAVAAAAALTACGGGGDGGSFGATGNNAGNNAGNNTGNNTPEAAATLAAKITELEDSGVLPKLERGNTLAGIDENSDGVRDDVAAYIDSHYTLSAQRDAAMQTARALQQTLSVDTADAQAVKNANLVLSRAVRCIYLSSTGAAGEIHPGRIVKEMEGVATNTKPRLMAYLQFTQALNGTTSTLPKGNTCE
jgi:hypothetical protein